jgi:hypothetical protein
VKAVSVIVLFVVLFSNEAPAQYLSESALFQRCYSQITSLRAKKKSDLFLKVKTGQKKAIDACKDVLASAFLTANGNEVISDQNDIQAKSVLGTFHRLHSSWFGQRDFPILSSNIRNKDTKNQYDSSTPALYFTRALFTPGASVKSAITSNEHLIAYRTQMDPPNGPDSGHAKTDYFYTPLIKFAPMGELIGIKSSGPQLLSYPAFGRDGAGSIDLYRNLGGGLLGTNSYLLLNMAEMKEDNYMTDGGVKMHRRWGKAIFNDLLCRELPAVRESDVVSMVDVNSSIPFRNSASCTKCHASQDRLASVVRNMKVVSLGAGKSEFGESVRGGLYPNFHAITHQAESAWPTIPDSNYYQRPTNGTFFFRTHAGELIDRPVSSIADVGQKISETEDFYICAAKRYYNYFTGVDVNIGDLGDTDWNYKPTSGDLFHREIVVSLGRNLKNHQSLSQLILEILSLDNYKKNDFGMGSTGK